LRPFVAGRGKVKSKIKKGFGMVRLFIYLLLFGIVFYSFSKWGQWKPSVPSGEKPQEKKSRNWFRPKKNPRETWVQVYETASMEEARVLQARLQEEEIECVVYEQGKRDIHGNSMKGVGVAVPKTSAPQAQAIIARMPV
jgi:hypothetical protein